jgi:hypothetical protein
MRFSNGVCVCTFKRHVTNSTRRSLRLLSGFRIWCFKFTPNLLSRTSFNQLNHGPCSLLPCSPCCRRFGVRFACRSVFDDSGIRPNCRYEDGPDGKFRCRCQQHRIERQLDRHGSQPVWRILLPRCWTCIVGCLDPLPVPSFGRQLNTKEHVESHTLPTIFDARYRNHYL